MIEGRYIGTVIINFHIDANNSGLLPSGKMKEAITEKPSGKLDELIRKETGEEETDVTVTKQHAWVKDPRKGGTE